MFRHVAHKAYGGLGKRCGRQRVYPDCGRREHTHPDVGRCRRTYRRRHCHRLSLPVVGQIASDLFQHVHIIVNVRTCQVQCVQEHRSDRFFARHIRSIDGKFHCPKRPRRLQKRTRLSVPTKIARPVVCHKRIGIRLTRRTPWRWHQRGVTFIAAAIPNGVQSYQWHTFGIGPFPVCAIGQHEGWCHPFTLGGDGQGSAQHPPWYIACFVPFATTLWNCVQRRTHDVGTGIARIVGHRKACVRRWRDNSQHTLTGVVYWRGSDGRFLRVRRQRWSWQLSRMEAWSRRC